MDTRFESVEARTLAGLMDEQIFPPIDRLIEGAGTRIGRYKLLQLIGEGGFGSVFMAEQETPVVRKVALKIIKLGMDTKQVIARFEAERQALAMMDHPNIAKVLDAGATETGRPYFVMELVKGIPIMEFCNQHHLPARKRLELFVEVCKAIQHAHQKGVIHRDLKPGNVLVTLHDGTPVPKVIDFGIAKATNQRLTEHTLFTEFRLFIGTPHYMPPEQADISGLDVDTRADIYSLGVLLYELLTDTTPFDPKQLRGSAYGEIQRIIREVEPPRPSTRLSAMGAKLADVAARMGTDPGKLSQSVTGELDWIVMKCLEKDRSRRYETANALARDVQRYLSDEPIEASPPSALYQLRKFARRNKTTLRVAAGIAALLVAATAVSSWQAIRATEAEKKTAETLRQVAAERDAKELARKDAEWMATFLTDVFRSPDPTRDGRTIRVVELLDKAAKKLETELADQPQRRAKLQATLASTYSALGLTRQAIPLQEQALEFYRKALGPDHLDTLWAMNNLADFYFDAGRRDEALTMREQTLALRRKINGPEHPDTLGAMLNLATSYDDAGRRDEAMKMGEEILQLRRKINGPENPETLSTMHNLAIFYSEAGRWAEAIKLQEQVLTLRRKVNGPEHPDTLRAMVALATSCAQVGRWQEALKMREDLLTLRRKVLGPEHPKTLSAMDELAKSYFEAGRLNEAIEMQEKVLTLSRKLLGPEDPGTLKAMDDLAFSYSKVGRRGEAITMQEQLLTLRRKLNGPDHPDTLGAMNNLANFYFEVGRTEDALRMRQDVLTIRRRVLGPEYPATITAMNNLASSYAQANRWDEAINMQEQALKLERKVIGPEHPDTLKAMNNLACFYDGAGRRDESLKLWEDVLTLRQKVLGPKHPDTLNTMMGFANSCFTSGRWNEALKLREQVLTIRREVLGQENPETVQAQDSLSIAYLATGAIQAWRGQEDQFEATCDKVLELAKDTQTAEVAERASKTCSLRKSDSRRCSAALLLARRAMELGQKNRNLPFFQMTLGMAEYRVGHYAEAIAALQAAELGGKDRNTVRDTSAFFRAMSLFRQGNVTEARALFAATEAQMKPFPADEKKPLAGNGVSHDDLIVWLACKEARELLNCHVDLHNK